MDNNRIIIILLVRGVPVEALIDSGATQNIMSEECATRLKVPLIRKTETYYIGTYRPGKGYKIEWETEPL